MQVIKLPSILTASNPIVNAEFRYQRFVIARGRVGWVWIILAGLMVAPALLISLAYTLAALVSPIIPQARGVLEIANQGFTPGLWLSVMIIAMYPVVTLITFALSANSIRREKSGNTWDNLRLTWIEPRAIVLGKWWASVRALNGDHAMVMVLRFGISAAMVMVMRDIIITPFDLPPEWTQLPLLLLITCIYSFLDAGLSAALGIAGAMVDAGGPIVPFILFSARVVTALLALVLWLGTLLVMPYGMGFTLLISLLGFVVYALVTWFVLRVAQVLVN